MNLPVSVVSFLYGSGSFFLFFPTCSVRLPFAFYSRPSTVSCHQVNTLSCFPRWSLLDLRRLFFPFSSRSSDLIFKDVKSFRITLSIRQRRKCFPALGNSSPGLNFDRPALPFGTGKSLNTLSDRFLSVDTCLGLVAELGSVRNCSGHCSHLSGAAVRREGRPSG